MLTNSTADPEVNNGVADQEFLYDADLLEKLDWNESRPLFQPEISPSNPGNNFLIRPLAKSDYDKGFPAVLEHLTAVGDVTKKQFLDTFRKMKNCSGMYYVTVVEDLMTNQIVGSATLLIEQKFIHSCALRGRIEDVVVSDSYRGKQIGKLIVETLKQLSKHIGCYKLSLDCRDEMISFYSQFGFHREDGNSNLMIIRFRS